MPEVRAERGISNRNKYYLVCYCGDTNRPRDHATSELGLDREALEFCSSFSISATRDGSEGVWPWGGS